VDDEKNDEVNECFSIKVDEISGVYCMCLLLEVKENQYSDPKTTRDVAFEK
jgi:hypothetical protein